MALSRKWIVIGNNREPVKIEKIEYTWQADAGGAVADQDLEIRGYIFQAITQPGSTAPTNLYDIVVKHKDTGVDLAKGQLMDRSDTNAELVRIADPAAADGTCTISISGNLVANATGTLILYVSDRP